MALSILASKIIQHAQCTRDTAGITLVEGFLIDGIDPAHNAMLQALVCPGVPAWGKEHPDDPLITAQQFSVKPFKNSRTRVWLMITYRSSDLTPVAAPVVEFHATTMQVRRCYDTTGKKMELDFIDSKGNYYPKTAVQLEDVKAIGILSAEWVEYSNPTDRLLPYMNAVNSDTYNTQPKWTWWVADISIRKQKYTAGYNIRVELRYDPEGWVLTVPYRDHFGKIPEDVDLLGSLTAPLGPATGGRGFYRATVKRIMSFAGLSIPTLL